MRRILLNPNKCFQAKSYAYTVQYPAHSRDPQSLVPEPIIKLFSEPCRIGWYIPYPIFGCSGPSRSTRGDSIPHGTLAVWLWLRRNQPPNEGKLKNKLGRAGKRQQTTSSCRAGQTTFKGFRILAVGRERGGATGVQQRTTRDPSEGQLTTAKISHFCPSHFFNDLESGITARGMYTSQPAATYTTLFTLPRDHWVNLSAFWPCLRPQCRRHVQPGIQPSLRRIPGQATKVQCLPAGRTAHF
jgi:hypothetical protein